MHILNTEIAQLIDFISDQYQYIYIGRLSFNPCRGFTGSCFQPVVVFCKLLIFHNMCYFQALMLKLNVLYGLKFGIILGTGTLYPCPHLFRCSWGTAVPVFVGARQNGLPSWHCQIQHWKNTSGIATACLHM